MPEQYDKSPTDSAAETEALQADQREQLAAIVTEHAPSLPDSERAQLTEQVAVFVGQLVRANDASVEGWIPVTGRYPAPGERVLIFIPRWGVLTIGWVSKNDATRWEMITMPGKTTDLVSHWQPLPIGPLTRPPQ